MNPLFRIDFSISDSLKIVRKSVLIYETIIGLMKKQATKGSEKRQKKQEQSELQQENKRLSEENYRLRMENDYLKKLNALIQKREKPE